MSTNTPTLGLHAAIEAAAEGLEPGIYAWVGGALVEVDERPHLAEGQVVAWSIRVREPGQKQPQDPGAVDGFDRKPATEMPDWMKEQRAVEDAS